MIKLKIEEDCTRVRNYLDVEFNGTEEEFLQLIQSQEYKWRNYRNLPGITIIKEYCCDRDIGYQEVRNEKDKRIAEK